MIMITGGAFQGKTKFAHKKFSLKESDIINGEACGFDEVFSVRCITNYHIFVKHLIENNIDPLEFTKRLCTENPDMVIIINEIGCGIIPLEKSERLWREQTGRAGCIIAEKASTVIRVSCGIPNVIKGTL